MVTWLLICGSHHPTHTPGGDDSAPPDSRPWPLSHKVPRCGANILLLETVDVVLGYRGGTACQGVLEQVEACMPGDPQESSV